MCRNLNSRLKAIESAKRISPHVLKVYDTYSDGNDLVALVCVFDETTAAVYDVDRYGEIEHERNIPVWDEPGDWQLCRTLGLDPRFTRIVDAA